MKTEIKSLTGLRGVAALWITLFHYIYIKFNFLIEKGYVAVDIFFVLSAFLLTISYSEKFRTLSTEKVNIFYKKRVNRIYPIYFFSLIFIILFVERASVADFIINAGLIQCFFNPNYMLSSVYWSLSTEWICYLIFPFMLYAVIRYRINAVLLIATGLCIRYFLLFLPDLYISGNKQGEAVQFDNYLDIAYGVNSLIRTVSCYLIGMAFALLANTKIWKSSFLMYGTVAVFFLSLTVEKGIFFVPLLSAILIKNLYNESGNAVKWLLESKPVYILGNISYSLYIIHFIFKKMELRIVSSYNLNGTLLILFSILLSYITYHLIEKKIKIFKV
ncbi:acyltransferase [uncultured Chryseobacterium sp.]|uniref:acyltransferase family protein n=1 Tax=uncultured Chryseobacterium sp. TaxID=259322 RepID=UPI0025E7AB01|nr:acyltransferase [uncultured Chryseobacterium sp.]